MLNASMSDRPPAAPGAIPKVMPGMNISGGPAAGGPVGTLTRSSGPAGMMASDGDGPPARDPSSEKTGWSCADAMPATDTQTANTVNLGNLSIMSPP